MRNSLQNSSKSPLTRTGTVVAGRSSSDLDGLGTCVSSPEGFVHIYTYRVEGTLEGLASAAAWRTASVERLRPGGDLGTTRAAKPFERCIDCPVATVA